MELRLYLLLYLNVVVAAGGVDDARLQYVASVRQVEAGLLSQVAKWGVVRPGQRDSFLTHLPTRFTVTMCVPGLVTCPAGDLVPLHTETTTLGIWTIPVNGSCRHYRLEYQQEVHCGCVGKAVFTSATPLYLSLPRPTLVWTITQLLPHLTTLPYHLAKDSECLPQFTEEKDMPGYKHVVNIPLGGVDSLEVQVCSSNVTYCPGGRVTLLDTHHITRCVSLASGRRVLVKVPHHTCGCSSNPAATTTLSATLAHLIFTVIHCGISFPASPFNLSHVVTHLPRMRHVRCRCGDLTQLPPALTLSHPALTQPSPTFTVPPPTLTHLDPAANSLMGIFEMSESASSHSTTPATSLQMVAGLFLWRLWRWWSKTSLYSG